MPTPSDQQLALQEAIETTYKELDFLCTEEELLLQRLHSDSLTPEDEIDSDESESANSTLSSFSSLSSISAASKLSEGMMEMEMELSKYMVEVADLEDEVHS
ncbi:hypothetical protein M407DRAFT_32332 [Tulasnella calospora MUT 4182]|uniref:Uncharacterized protein n=1 Tax=Tulasnella calospora MUT 4182 TaxID=1051891 RepID=A0A0C3PTB3_9AGAM|nr:hypothetical protein M407DRAFT_32332 [Tulasnella calospora MUT 4182]